MKISIEQRLKRLEESILKEKVKPSNVTAIKFNGGELTRVTKDSWRNTVGQAILKKTVKFPDGTAPFITFDVKISKNNLYDLNQKWGEFNGEDPNEDVFEDNNAVVIFDFYKRKYTVHIITFDVDNDPYVFRKYYSSFEAAVKGLNNLDSLVDDPLLVDNSIDFFSGRTAEPYAIMPKVLKPRQNVLTSDELFDVVYGFTTLIEQKLGHKRYVQDSTYDNIIFLPFTLRMTEEDKETMYEKLTEIAYILEKDDRRLHIEVYLASGKSGYKVEILSSKR